MPSSRHSVSDVTVIHYCGASSNANAQINIYYGRHKVLGILRLPREDISKELLCNIWHFKFKSYKALQEISVSDIAELSRCLSEGKMRAICKYRVLLCHSPLLRVAEFIRRGGEREKNTRGSTSVAQRRPFPVCVYVHTSWPGSRSWILGPSSPGNNKGNGEKFIAPWKKGRRGCGKVVAISERSSVFPRGMETERKRKKVWWVTPNADEWSIFPIESYGFIFVMSTTVPRDSEIERNWIAARDEVTSLPYVSRDWKMKKKIERTCKRIW